MRHVYTRRIFGDVSSFMVSPGWRCERARSKERRVGVSLRCGYAITEWGGPMCLCEFVCVLTRLVSTWRSTTAGKMRQRMRPDPASTQTHTTQSSVSGSSLVHGSRTHTRATCEGHRGQCHGHFACAMSWPCKCTRHPHTHTHLHNRWTLDGRAPCYITATAGDAV